MAYLKGFQLQDTVVQRVQLLFEDPRAASGLNFGLLSNNIRTFQRPEVVFVTEKKEE